MSHSGGCGPFWLLAAKSSLASPRNESGGFVLFSPNGLQILFELCRGSGTGVSLANGLGIVSTSAFDWKPWSIPRAGVSLALVGVVLCPGAWDGGYRLLRRGQGKVEVLHSTGERGLMV